MKEFYGPQKKDGLEVPAILGLTASPLMKANLEDLEVLEATLDAICKTPTKHRDELIAQVKRPTMKTVLCEHVSGQIVQATLTQSMASLNQTYRELDIARDPKILYLRAGSSKKSRERLNNAVIKNRTNCQRQMRSFCNGAKAIFTSLGPWAADWYIHKVILEFLAGLDDAGGGGDDLSEEERRYLADALQKVIAPPPSAEPTELSPKVKALVEILVRHTDSPRGIVFVKERASATVLRHLLSVHPAVAGHYHVSTMVGTSKSPGRKQAFLDLSQKEDISSLEKFRRGTTNLLVATSVLEEGIDVPKCNLIICFDEPKTLKSFVQRRGRARAAASHLYLLVLDMNSKTVLEWLEFEKKMKERYEDDMRDIKAMEDLEKSDDADYPVLEGKGTGARLAIDDAKSHLNHFCATLSSRKFVDSSPYYVIHTSDGKPLDLSTPQMLKATVHLPGTISPELREFEGAQFWSSEDLACKDAAFQAYLKLYEAGMVNENLLPIREKDLGIPEVEQCDGIATVKQQLNPWVNVARKWQKDEAELFRRRLLIENRDKSMSIEVDVVLPVPIPLMDPLTIYWDSQTSWTVTLKPNRLSGRNSAVFNGKTNHTQDLLSMAFGHRTGWVDAQKKYPVRFIATTQNVRMPDLSAQEYNPDAIGNLTPGHIVRDVSLSNHPYFYMEWLPRKPPADMVGRLHRTSSKSPDLSFESAPDDVPYIVVKTWPKKVGFFRPPLQPTTRPSGSGKRYPRIYPAEKVRVDNTPAVFPHVGMLIPAITHALEVHLVATDLLENVLDKTGIENVSQVVTAISASSARGPTDYERVEFLGDSILKFCTTVNACAKCKFSLILFILTRLTFCFSFRLAVAGRMALAI